MTSTGYTMEMLIPWNTIGFAPFVGHTLGIDVHLNDDDDGGDRDKKLSWTDLQDIAWTNPSVLGDYLLGDPCDRITVDLKLFMEGPYDLLQSSMTGSLLQMGLLPSRQLYTVAPWNYPGLEGDGWTPSDYPVDAIDWVLLSFRTSTDPTSELTRVAALVLEDGTIPSFDLNLTGNLQSVYVVAEHRNHLPVMTPQSILISGGSLTYDFTTENSYAPGAGFGQKQIGSDWMMYGGNPDQSGLNSCDINAVDRILWESVNGTFGVYNIGDFDFDGDVNAADKVLFFPNNGIYSTIPK